MVHGLGWALGSDWGLVKATGRMGEEDVKGQQQLKRRKEEKEEATPVIQLQMLPLAPKVLEIHIVQSGP